MDLDEVQSKAQLRRALKRGDEELEEDIQRALQREVDQAHSNVTWENEHGMEVDELILMAKRDDSYSWLIDEFEDREEIKELLADVPDETVEESLRDHVERAAFVFTQGGRQDPLFAFATGQGPGANLRPMYYEMQIHLDEPLSWVPKANLIEALHDLTYEHWEHSDEDTYSTGWIDSGEHWRLEFERYAGLEWATDIRNEYFSNVVEGDPRKAVETFMHALQRRDAALYRKVQKAKFPQEVLLDLAVSFFDDPESAYEVVAEAVGEWGYQGSRGKVLLEVDETTLREIGVTQDRWIQGAPWKLVDLPVEELAYEGTLMRHCVGRRSMGYRDAVARGDTRIWSLRSRFNKPILTFEIDAREWERAADTALPSHRASGELTSQDDLVRLRRRIHGRAIEQLKGKLNRLAGEDRAEAAVLFWIFQQLEVDPAFVEDFVARPARSLGNPGFNGPWRPYVARIKSRLTRW